LASVATAVVLRPRPCVLCVGRHRYLSEHLARVFDGFGVDALTAVGLRDGSNVAASCGGAFDAVLCDYDLVEPLSEDEWRAVPILSLDRLVIVSLNRKHDELPPLAVRGATRFLYLPLTTRELALKAIERD
jgi:hypothetical protein